MLLNTTGKDAIDVDPRDIVQITASGVTVLRTLQGAGQHIVHLTDDSAEVARAAMLPAPRSEIDLFDLAAGFGRRDVFDFRIPGTSASHKVECVVMEASDIGAFVSAIGLPIARDPAAVASAPKFRRLSDRLEAGRQRVLEPDAPVGGEGGHDAVAEYAHRTGLASPPSDRLVAAARELLADQSIAAGAAWPIEGTQPRQYVVLGVAPQLLDLVPGAKDKLHQLQAEADALERERDGLRKALLEVRHSLQFANDTPNGPIQDTLWMMHGHETVFDFIDSELGEKAAT